MSKQKPYQYGDPAPKNYHEAAKALKSLQNSKRKPSDLSKKLDSIEQLLKDHK